MRAIPPGSRQWLDRVLVSLQFFPKNLVGYSDMYAGIDCTAGPRGTERMFLDLVINPRGIMLWISAEPKEQPEILERVKRW